MDRRTTPWPAWPVFEPDEIEAATAVLRSGRVNYWTGDEGRAFEREFAARIGVEHAVALANGTVALELCLHGLGIGAGDDVVVPSRTFVATATAVAARRGRPVFADVDPRSGNVNAQTVEAALTDATRAVIVVHLGGWPCDMAALAKLCRDRGLALIEDCAQAHGATVGGRPVGAWGDVAAYSFCQDKIMTTGGEGGMVVTGRRDVWERMWSYKDHGKSWDAVYEREHAPGFRWLHESLGTNWRMTEMQSAIGRRQLAKLDAWVGTRRANAQRLAQRLAQHDALRVPWPEPDARGAFYRLYAYTKPDVLGADWSRDKIMGEVSALGVPCMSGSCSEIYRERAFPPAWKPAQPHPVARQLGETSLAFLVHHTVAERDIDDAADAVDSVLARAGERE